MSVQSVFGEEWRLLAFIGDSVVVKCPETGRILLFNRPALFPHLVRPE